METVKKRIKNLRISNAAQRDYIPEDDLAKVLDEACIRALVRQETFGIDKVYHKSEVFGNSYSYRRTNELEESFAIRLCENGPDNCLPLDEAGAEKLFSDKDSVKEFLKTQWEFTTLLFRQNSFPKVYDSNTIFPYYSDQRLERPRGNSTIYETEVDTRYLSLNRKIPVGLKSLTIIRKEVPEGDRAEFEARVHRYLNSTENDCILEMYYSYTFKGYTSMLFEKCDSTLEEFLMSADSEGFEEPQSFIHALYGLSGAIKELHNFDSTELHIEKIGCHYDLKPNNILVKLDDEKFILADFGEAAFKDAFEDSRQIAGNVGGDAIAPEWENLDQDFTKLTPGRSSDVWSFGCILLEVVVRMHEGLDGLKEFRKLRKTRQSYHTHYRFHANGQLNIAVRDKMNALSSEHTPEPISALISMIHAMLIMDPQQRKNIQWVTSRLEKFANPTGDQYPAIQGCARDNTVHFQHRSLTSVSSLHSPLNFWIKHRYFIEATSASDHSAEIQATTVDPVPKRKVPRHIYRNWQKMAAQSDTEPSPVRLIGEGSGKRTGLPPKSQSNTKYNSFITSMLAVTQEFSILEQRRFKSLWRSPEL
ncbi:serine threonine kinase protein [Rutstroemia sp. NJR-2017a WRK4]|nr:serine threonine kinase protein [Rutstroemia sp. NJR-2017a WRK4]